MTIFDIIILALLLAAVLITGLTSSRREQSRREFETSGSSLPWGPIGISIMATFFSAMNFTAFTSEIMTNGLYVLLVLPAFFIITLPVIIVIIPFYRRTASYSAYAFLENKFGPRVRKLAAGIFVAWRMAWMAVILYAPCIFLASMMHMDYRLLVIAIGLATLTYTMTGGMRAIVWTDVVQSAIILGTAAACLIIISRETGSFTSICQHAADLRILAPFYPFDKNILSWDPRTRITLWSCLIGGSVAFLARYGADQMVVQRYISARSLKSARIAFVFNIASIIVVLCTLAVLGVAARVYLANRGHSMPADTEPVGLLASFMTILPPGMLGLFASAIIASTMSSMDSGIHSCCTIISHDLMRKYQRNGDKNTRLPYEKTMPAYISGLVILASMFVGRLGTLFAIANRIINGLGSPLLALLLFGVIAKKSYSKSIYAGGICALVFSVCVTMLVDNLSLHYYALANLLGSLLILTIFYNVERILQKAIE